MYIFEVFRDHLNFIFDEFLLLSPYRTASIVFVILEWCTEVEPYGEGDREGWGYLKKVVVSKSHYHRSRNPAKSMRGLLPIYLSLLLWSIFWYYRKKVEIHGTVLILWAVSCSQASIIMIWKKNYFYFIG